MHLPTGACRAKQSSPGQGRGAEGVSVDILGSLLVSTQTPAPLTRPRTPETSGLRLGLSPLQFIPMLPFVFLEHRSNHIHHHPLLPMICARRYHLHAAVLASMTSTPHSPSHPCSLL